MRALAMALAIGGTVTFGPSAHAHHSYGAYDRDTLVTVEGTVRAFSWTNPHPLLEVATAHGTVYTIEWWTTGRLAQTGVTRDAVKRGDRVAVVGYIMRDKSQRRMSMVRMVRRLTDGQQWGG